jgi:hypothetical protein
MTCRLTLSHSIPHLQGVLSELYAVLYGVGEDRRTISERRKRHRHSKPHLGNRPATCGQRARLRLQFLLKQRRRDLCGHNISLQRALRLLELGVSCRSRHNGKTLHSLPAIPSLMYTEHPVQHSSQAIHSPQTRPLIESSRPDTLTLSSRPNLRLPYLLRQNT